MSETNALPLLPPALSCCACGGLLSTRYARGNRYFAALWLVECRNASCRLNGQVVDGAHYDEFALKNCPVTTTEQENHHVSA